MRYVEIGILCDTWWFGVMLVMNPAGRMLTRLEPDL